MTLRVQFVYIDRSMKVRCNFMPTANIKTIKKCAFCKHWYDTMNSAISPRSPKINLWEYDDKCKKKCLQKNYDTSASAFCGKYECKVDVM